jgi:PhnB protein
MCFMPTSYKRDRFHAVTPHLTVDGAARYIEFLQQAFGAVESSRSPGPGGKLMHAEIMIGDSVIMLNDAFPDFGTPPIAQGFWPIALHVYVPDADAVFERAKAAGCEVLMPLDDQFWGDRYGQVKDPFGFRWAIATHKEDLTPEQLQERAAKMFGGAAT